MKTFISIILLFLALTINAQPPIDLQTAFSKSYLYEEQEDYSAAINELTGHYDASSYEINVRLGYLSYYAGDYVGSLKYYKIAMDLMPYSIEAKFGCALPLSAIGDWNEVVKLYQAILTTDPQNSIANYRLGVIYYERAEFPTAMKFTEKVVNMYPYDYDSVILLAWINLKMEDYRKAKILFNKSLLISPGNSSAIEGLELIQ
jgi:tetratricopeptide (TPR) repeat protein